MTRQDSSEENDSSEEMSDEEFEEYLWNEAIKDGSEEYEYWIK